MLRNIKLFAFPSERDTRRVPANSDLFTRESEQKHGKIQRGKNGKKLRQVISAVKHAWRRDIIKTVRTARKEGHQNQKKLSLRARPVCGSFLSRPSESVEQRQETVPRSVANDKNAHAHRGKSFRRVTNDISISCGFAGARVRRETMGKPVAESKKWPRAARRLVSVRWRKPSV